MTSRKRANRPMYQKPSKKIRSDALMAANYVGDTSSLFFALPLELRNLVYDALWRHNKVIAANQHSSKIDMRAYLTDENLRDAHKDFSRHREHKLRPRNDILLPQWLLTSKLFLREAIARFNHRSHWLLRPVSRAGPYTPLPLTTIMIPGLAHSLSLGIWKFERPITPATMRQREMTRYDLKLVRSDTTWLTNLADYLSAQNTVKRLALTLSYPRVPPPPALQLVLDLAPFEYLLARLPRLETVKVDIELCGMSGEAKVRLWQVFETAVQQAVERGLGACMVHESHREGRNSMGLSPYWDRHRMGPFYRGPFYRGPAARVFTFRKVAEDGEGSS